MLTPVVTGLIGVGGRIGGVLGAAFLERPRQKDIERQRDKSSSRRRREEEEEEDEDEEEEEEEEEDG